MKSGLKRDCRKEASKLVSTVYRYDKYCLQLTFMHFNLLMAREFERSIHASNACTLAKKTLFEIDSELEKLDPRHEIRELLKRHYKNVKGKKVQKKGAEHIIQSVAKLLEREKLQPLTK